MTVPEGEQGSWKIDRFTIPEDDLYRFKLMVEGRDPGYGDFTRLLYNDLGVIMSDTRAEVVDHLPAMWALRQTASPVLIHGLGLGLVLQEAIRLGHPDITVVEIELDVIDLVASHYLDMAEERGVVLHIHHHDAMTWKPPKGKQYGVVWHDIWPTICPDNLDQMHTLHRRFGGRADWQGSWARGLCERMRG